MGGRVRKGGSRWAVAVLVAAAAVGLTPGHDQAQAHLPLVELLPTVDFVTVYDPDGAGPGAPEAPREHSVPVTIGTGLPLAGGTPIEVTGSGLPDLSVMVEVPATLDSQQPKITIETLPGAPDPLPVRIEALVEDEEDPQRRVSLGYDTQATTAPQRFVADLDLRQLDLDPDTRETSVGLEIGAAGESLTLVSESFIPGAGLNERNDRTIRRVKYSGKQDGSARVPATAGIDLTEGEGSQRAVLTRSHPSVVTLLAEAAGEPRLLATIDRLPASLDLTLDESGPGRGIEYLASDPVERLDVNATAESPLFADAREVAVRLEDLPLALSARFGEDGVRLDAKGDAVGLLEVTAQDEPGRSLDAPACSSEPCEDGFDLLRDAALAGVILDTDGRYLLHSRIRRLELADVKLEPELDALLDTAPEIVPPDPGCDPIEGGCGPSERFQPFEAFLRSPGGAAAAQELRAHVASLLPSTRLRQADEGGTNRIVYSDEGTGGGTAIEIDGKNVPGLPAGRYRPAREIHIDLRGMPRQLELTRAAGGFPLSVEAGGAGNSVLGEAEIQLTSGPDERLPRFEVDDDGVRQLDGLYSRDDPERFVTFARVRSLSSLALDQREDGDGDVLQAALDADSPESPALRIDTREELSPDEEERVLATISTLPRDLSLVFRDSPALTRLDYSAAQTAERFDFEKRRIRRDFGDLGGEQVVRLIPMPRKFEVCKADTGDACTPGMFGRSEANSGSIRISAEPRTSFTYFDHPVFRAFATFTQVGLDVREFALQAHSESEFIGVFLARGGEGYMAMDTDWAADPHPHADPPGDARLSGLIHQSESITTGVKLEFGDPFAAERRIMDFDSDDPLDIFDASGHAVCGAGTKMVSRGPEDTLLGAIKGGETDFTEHFCE